MRTRMMATMKRSWVAVACLLIGALGGAAAAQNKGAATGFINTALFELKDNEEVRVYITLDDIKSGQPAKVRLRFFNELGAVKLFKEVTLQPGQSDYIAISEAGFFRGQAEIFDLTTTPSTRRAFVGGGEIRNLTTLQRGPVCSLPDNGVPVGRQ